jgi:hypothetical protein
MEEEEQDTGASVADQDFASFLATIGSQTASSQTFGPNFQYSRRVISGYGPQITQAQRQAIEAQLKRISSPGAAESKRYYEGEFLVDANGLISRAPYDARKDAEAILYQLKPQQRLTYSNLIASRGFYGNSKPTAAGTLSTDRTAWAEFLTASNAQGLTWDTFASQLSLEPPVRGLGGGSRYRVSEPEDIEAYLRQASLERLGRTMTRSDVDAAIAAIQGREATGSAPSLGVAAEQQVLQREPDRERSYRFARAIDLAMSELGG